MGKSWTWPAHPLGSSIQRATNPVREVHILCMKRTRGQCTCPPGGTAEKPCEGCLRATDWSRDEKTLLMFGGSPYQINALDIPSHRQTPVLKHPNYSLLYARFSPDNCWVSFTARIQPNRAQILIAPLDGPKPLPESAWIRIAEEEAGGPTGRPTERHRISRPQGMEILACGGGKSKASRTGRWARPSRFSIFTDACRRRLVGGGGPNCNGPGREDGQHLDDIALRRALKQRGASPEIAVAHKLYARLSYRLPRFCGR